MESVSSIVMQAVLKLLIYLGFGMGIYWFNADKFVGNETNFIFDAFNFCILLMCTISYGDSAPQCIIARMEEPCKVSYILTISFDQLAGLVDCSSARQT